MTVPNPNHLLDRAGRLATQGGAPRQADLRRAISDTYYAIFHAVVTEAADLFVGRKKRDSARYSLLYRGVDHRVLRKVCDGIAKSPLPARYAAYAPKAGFGPELEAVASTIIDLQERRYLADYDPLFRASLSDTLFVVASGRSALARFRSVGRSLRHDFVTLVVFPPR